MRALKVFLILSKTWPSGDSLFIKLLSWQARVLQIETLKVFKTFRVSTKKSPGDPRAKKIKKIHAGHKLLHLDGAKKDGAGRTGTAGKIERAAAGAEAEILAAAAQRFGRTGANGIGIRRAAKKPDLASSRSIDGIIFRRPDRFCKSAHLSLPAYPSGQVKSKSKRKTCQVSPTSSSPTSPSTPGYRARFRGRTGAIPAQ
jgi:hypothetical protein